MNYKLNETKTDHVMLLSVHAIFFANQNNRCLLPPKRIINTSLLNILDNRFFFAFARFVSILLIAANTATVSKSISQPATTHSSTGATIKRTLRASHTPAIKWRTAQCY